MHHMLLSSCKLRERGKTENKGSLLCLILERVDVKLGNNFAIIRLVTQRFSWFFIIVGGEKKERKRFNQRKKTRLKLNVNKVFESGEKFPLVSTTFSS